MTGIESWIVKKAVHRREHFKIDEKFTYPYNLGWKENLRQVFNWSGDLRPIGDGYSWNLIEGRDQFSLTREQLLQKEDKRVHAVKYICTQDYSGTMFPCGLGCKVLCCVPWIEESRVRIRKQEILLVTRWQKHWLYGEKVVEDPSGQTSKSTENSDENTKLLTQKVIKGWFPVKCVRVLENPRATKKRKQEEKNEKVDADDTDYEIIDDVKSSKKDK
jgi:hypothetical protein